MTVQYYDENSVWGRIYISPNARMKGRFNIIGIGDSELSSYMTIRAYKENDVNATLQPRVIGKKEHNAFFDVKYFNESYILSTIQAYENNLLDGTMLVRPHGSMVGIFDIVEPPRVTDNLASIQDATVRSLESNKYINYGNYSTMMVGASFSGEYLGSYIKFPLDSYPDTLTVLDAKLRIYYTADIEENVIELLNIDRDWTEYGVTYANRPILTDVVSNSYTINKTNKYIEFDLLDYVQGVVNDRKDNFGLGIIANNNKSYSLFTKESSLQPTLTMTYFDTRILSIGRADLTSTLFAYGAGSEDLNGFFSVHQTADTNDLLGTFYIHRYDTPVHYDKLATLMVSVPDLYGNLTIVQNDDNDLISTLTVRRDVQEDREAFFNVNNPHLYSRLYVNYHNNLDSNLHVRVLKEDDVFGFINITVDSLYGSLYVIPTNDLNAFVTIQGFNDSELESLLAVNKPDLLGRLFVRYRSDLSSYVTIRKENMSELESVLIINTPDLNSHLDVKYYSDLESEVTVRQQGNLELLSFININTPELNATILVKEYNDLQASVAIRQSSESELIGFINVSKPNLQATIIAKSQISLDITMAISVPEMNVIMITRAYKEEDVMSTLLPRVVGASDLHATISSLNKYRSGSYYFII